MAERYPTVRAGQKVTGSLLDSMLPKTVRKTADTSRTSNTASADPELQITVEANGVYIVEGTLYVTATDIVDGGGAVDDINIDWSAPSGSDGTWSGQGPLTNATSTETQIRTIGTAITSSRTFGVGSTSAAAPAVIDITATLIVGSTAGTYSLDWAVGTGTSGPVVVYQDSWLKLTRIA